VDAPSESDWFDLLIANSAIGGQFTSRINMNLREDKGYTYGARSDLRYDFAGGSWVASTGVHTDKTAPALVEVFKEIRAPGADHPLAEAEIGDARNALVYAWPLRFESPDFLLGQEEAVWRYGLPANWISDYLPKLRGVTGAQALAAWNARIHPEALTCVVVGDAAVIRESLATIGLPIIERDADGALLLPKVEAPPAPVAPPPAPPPKKRR
jgi:predicted Zn-dependent peptidase